MKINLQISKSGNKCQEKVVRQWEENKVTNFEIGWQMSTECSEAVKKKILQILKSGNICQEEGSEAVRWK